MFDVLPHYVNIVVDELDRAKLLTLLRLQYHDSLANAFADLIRQQHFYEPAQMAV